MYPSGDLFFFWPPLEEKDLFNKCEIAFKL